MLIQVHFFVINFSPKLSQLCRQLTERQLGYKSNSSYHFTDVRHVKSDLCQLTDDHAFSLAKFPLIFDRSRN